MEEEVQRMNARVVWAAAAGRTGETRRMPRALAETHNEDAAATVVILAIIFAVMLYCDFPFPSFLSYPMKPPIKSDPLAENASTVFDVISSFLSLSTSLPSPHTPATHDAQT